jgi:hypothetical protein
MSRIRTAMLAYARPGSGEIHLKVLEVFLAYLGVDKESVHIHAPSFVAKYEKVKHDKRSGFEETQKK